MKLSELKAGDKLWCFRIDIRTLEAVYLELKVISIGSINVDVKSGFLERYSIYGSLESEINGKSIVLDCGRDEEIIDYLEEYLFETLNACKEFAVEYCKDKIKTYEQNIQTIKGW